MQEAIIHFGLRLNLKKRGHKLTRENYANISKRSTFGKNYIYIQAQEENNEKLLKIYNNIYEDNEGCFYSDEWCEIHLVNVMKNYDLNIEYFKNLNRTKFNKEIMNFVKKTKFEEITDLNNYSCAGYYVMILDEYCQAYIGTSQNIKMRIRQHWYGGKMRFDRLLCGEISNSKLSIDSFRALDTTRILAYKTNRIYTEEDKFINLISNEFICNRTFGGLPEFGTLDVAANIKHRKL